MKQSGVFGGGRKSGGGNGTGGIDSDEGETQAGSVSTRRGGSGEKGVLYGRQAGGAQEGLPDAGEAEKTSGTETTSDTREERRRAYRDLVNGEYKEFFTEDTQRIIDRRFRETKQLQQQVGQYQPIIDQLMQRYGVEDVGKLAGAIENDDSYWSQAAEQAGMSVEQYKKFQKLQRENAELLRQQRRQVGEQRAQEQLRQWHGEAEQVRRDYPSFDLGRECQNPQFLSMLRAGVPVRHAYEVVHMEDIKAGVARMQARATEKQVVDGIRAKGARPPENGTAAQSAFTVKDDVSKLTRQDRAEIARRVMRGEKIVF